VENSGAGVLTNSTTSGRPSLGARVVTRRKFHDANPKIYTGFPRGEKEAIALINKDKQQGQRRILNIARQKSTLDEIFGVINDKVNAFTLLPEKVFKTAVFMGKVGT